MAKTKSGIESPADYNGKSPSSISAPVKTYPASSKIGKGADKSGKGGGCIEGPASK